MSQDVKLESAIRLNLRSFEQIKHIENHVVLNAGRRFHDNIYRVWHSAVLLPWMVGKTMLYQDAATRVDHSATQAETNDPAFSKKRHKQIHEITDADEALCNADKAIAFERDAQAYNAIRFLLECYPDPKKDGGRNELLVGFDALFQSMLIGSWTAFEILEKDLRKAVAQKFGKKFADKCPAICEAINSQSITALYAVRNVLTHSNGVINPPFIKQSCGVDSLTAIRADAIEMQKDGGKPQIICDGEFVKRMLEPMVASACGLIVAVDALLNQTIHQK